MSLKIVHEDGLNMPMAFCDTCGKPITDAEKALVLWVPEDDVAESLHFAHKGKCDRRMIDGEHTFWMELAEFLAYVVNNSTIDTKLEV